MFNARLCGLAFPILTGLLVEHANAGPPECTSNCFAWQERSVGPEARSGHALVYDEIRDVLVLFGGSSSEILGDTWERRDGEWQLRDCSGPAPRSGHAMVYDSLRGVTVLFGGYAAGVALRDTWEWDGVAWTLVAESGPSPRSGHSMAFDRERGRTVLFGGYNYETFGDTWEWDGAVWTQRAAPGPTPRYEHSMTYDEQRGVSVMYGGTSYTSDSFAVWEWDGSEWHRSDPTSGAWPEDSYADSMIYDPSHGVAVLLLGGWCDVPCLQVWEWDGARWEHRADHDLQWGPNGAAAAFDRKHGVGRVFGGTTYGEQIATSVPSDDLWGLNPDGWIHVDIGAPARRWGHAMAYDSYREVSVLFGGNATTYDPVGPLTWEWDGANWSVRSDAGPRPRTGHAMSFDSARAVTVLFGGGSCSSCYDAALWEWNGRWWVPRTEVGPIARRDHAMAFDSLRRVTVMFGGESSGIPLGDTWEWDGIEWQLRAEIGPDPRLRHTMAFDSARGVTVLFGGVGEQRYGDTWEWDGSTWSLRSTMGPSPREKHAMVFDEKTGRTILFGGEGCGESFYSCGDTWAWDGLEWRVFAMTGPTSRMGHAMVFDSHRGVTVLFGGRSFPYPIFGETWELDVATSADQDADGVLDECDQCPATPSGFGALETGCIAADHNLDGDVDLADFQAIQNCREAGYVSNVCGVFDLDHNYYIDEIDMAGLISMLSGPD